MIRIYLIPNWNHVTKPKTDWIWLAGNRQEIRRIEDEIPVKWLSKALPIIVIINTYICTCISCMTHDGMRKKTTTIIINMIIILLLLLNRASWVGNLYNAVVSHLSQTTACERIYRNCESFTNFIRNYHLLYSEKSRDPFFSSFMQGHEANSCIEWEE